MSASLVRAAGLVATCNPGGAGKWRPEYAEAFKGASAALVIPDSDAPGRAHAAAVARALLGAVPVVKVVPLPAGVKDATEWFSRGGTAKALWELAAAAPDFVTENSGAERANGDHHTVNQTPVSGGSRTSPNHGVVPGSSSLRDEPVRTAVRENRPEEKPRTALPFETLFIITDHDDPSCHEYAAANGYTEEK